MLNWEEIADRIENPKLCSENEVQELRVLCDKFPFSQVFPLLYLKVLSQGNRVDFEEELQKYAYKITDRVKLYNLLYQKEEGNLVEELSIKEIGDALDINTIEIESQENLEEQINDFKLIDNVQEEHELDELDKDIIASSVAAAYSVDELIPDSTQLQEFDLSISDEFENSEMEFPSVSTSNQNYLSEKTFLEWLINSKNSQLIEVVEEEEAPYEVTYIEFEKPRKEFFSPTKKAKESLSEETLPVSETLARIYQSQGNISKAIFVYQQLILIIPEKKSYFASQIKSLKKK
ncbi:MAG: hypothetical protein FJX84_08090 [Bacteroidetes bacterium]|nr:hypothetical protein [Bacteroidota bacterium]